MKNEQKEIKDAEIVQPKESKKNNKKKNILKWAGIVFSVTALLLGLQYFSFVKKAEARREAQAEQEQLLVSHWQDQGLSNEEIQEKLRESRMESFDPDDAPLVFQLMRTFRHATGTGPGDGTGPGGVPPEGREPGSGMGMGLRGGQPR